jgi:site-specific DNA-adenine methylase
VTPLKAPFPWFGGKSRAAALVWDHFGDVGNYVEPFAGSLAVLLGRPHAPRIETCNDADTFLANFWRALQHDPELVAHHADWPVSEVDLQARHKWLCDRADFRAKMLADPDYYDAKIAGWWVWGISQWIGAGWCSRPEWMGRGQGGRAPRGLNANIHLNGEMGIHGASWAGNLDGQNKRPVVNRGGRGVAALSATGSGMARLPKMDRSCGITAKMPKMDRGSSIHSGRKIRTTDNPDWQHRPQLTNEMGVHQRRAQLVAWMEALADRLRRVRVCCGDWARIVTPSCTWKLGGGQLTGVFLDPPYSHSMRDNRLYSVEDDVAAKVRNWAIKNGENRNLRIALCGLYSEHEMPEGWRQRAWKAPQGYSNKGKREEVIWFSPYCLFSGNLFEEGNMEAEGPEMVVA